MDRHKNYLNPDQREYYKQLVKSDDRALERVKTSQFNSVRAMDTGEIIRRKRKNQKILNERTAPKIEDRDKNKAWARFKELKEELKGALMNKNDMHPIKTINGKIVADMDTAKNNAFELVKRIESGQDDKIREYRDLARLLEPDDPNIGNVEQLRKNNG